MTPRLIARTDENQADIVSALRRVGAVVACTHQLGTGYPDLTVAYGGRNWLIECKMPGAALTPDEERFHEEWRQRGQIAVVTAPEEAIELVTLTPERQGEWWYG